MAKPGLIFIMILSVIIKLRPILGETRVTCSTLLQQGRQDPNLNLYWKILIRLPSL